MIVIDLSPDWRSSRFRLSKLRSRRHGFTRLPPYSTPRSRQALFMTHRGCTERQRSLGAYTTRVFLHTAYQDLDRRSSQLTEDASMLAFSIASSVVVHPEVPCLWSGATRSATRIVDRDVVGTSRCMDRVESHI